MSIEPATDPRDAHVAALEARVAELEAELTDQARRSARVVAQAQEKLYWLERWQVDLDSVMRRPGAVPALEALKRVRSVSRGARRYKRRLFSS